jgi:predicted RNA polymerase sigma factor
LWDAALINQGWHFLRLSARGHEVSSYHLEARIASWHCIKADTPEKWENILQLYDQLLLVNYSPSVALHRTFALYKARGQHAALAAAEKLQLENNHFYFILLGELYKNIDRQKAGTHFEKAYALAKTQIEKQQIRKKLDDLAWAI